MAGQQLSTISVPYSEVIGDTQMGGATFSYDEPSQATWTIRLNSPAPRGSGAWDNVAQAVKDILGVHYRSGDNLVRLPPIRHPKYPTLYAVRVSVNGVAFDAQNAKDFDPASNQMSSARYVLPVLQIGFAAPQYDPYFPANTTIADPRGHNLEWLRYVITNFQVTTKALKLDIGTVYYAEGTPSGGVLPFGPQKVLPSGTLTLQWLRVPHDYIFSTGLPAEGGNVGLLSHFYGNPQAPNALAMDGVTPVPVVGAVGKVNYDWFLGNAPGTLLCRPPELRPSFLPLPLASLQPTKLRLWDVTIPMDVFDPPLGTGATTRGHNTALWSFNKGPGIFADGKNYLVRIGSVTGALLYDTYDFDNMFLPSGCQFLSVNQ
jgi:hypothetical protein